MKIIQKYIITEAGALDRTAQHWQATRTLFAGIPSPLISAAGIGWKVSKGRAAWAA